tara:strand:+ start:775 stop:1290 length:516 start_codon:yes stop_codon:yes gene_type:complete
MKKLLILLLFFGLIGCNITGKNNQASNNFNCPRVFFSSEDRIFIDINEGGTSIDDVTFKAELNNFVFIEKCSQQNEVAIIPLHILIIAQPMNELKNPDVSMPLYVFLLDKNDKVLETQYFMVSSSIKKNFETKNFKETDITDKLNIITKNFETNQIVIGFMLDDEKKLLID